MVQLGISIKNGLNCVYGGEGLEALDSGWSFQWGTLYNVIFNNMQVMVVTQACMCVCSRNHEKMRHHSEPALSDSSINRHHEYHNWQQLGRTLQSLGWSTEANWTKYTMYVTSCWTQSRDHYITLQIRIHYPAQEINITGLTPTNLWPLACHIFKLKRRTRVWTVFAVHVHSQLAVWPFKLHCSSN